MLRVLVDRRDRPARFLILGSASGDLLRQSSESLAGRMERIEIGGFSLRGGRCESPRPALWRRGGFPRAFLARTEADSLAWRRGFIQTLLERDLPQWGVRVPATALLRFWTMVAHYHGQTWNATEPARALGVSPTTTRRYLDLLTDALMVRQLQPWHANLGKRQVKSPKVYVRDSGLLHQLLGLETEKALLSHPKIGASWEGFVIEQVLAIEPHDEAFFWATHQGAEIDLILRRGDRLFGVECKRADAPRLTPSIRIALDDLGLERVAVDPSRNQALRPRRSGGGRAARRAGRRAGDLRRGEVTGKNSFVPRRIPRRYFSRFSNPGSVPLRDLRPRALAQGRSCDEP